MKVVTLFRNIGSYHAARLRAAGEACRQRGWTLTVLQTSDFTFEHPWGDLSDLLRFPIETLIPAEKDGTLDPGDVARAAVPILRARLDAIRPDVIVVPGWSMPEARACIRWHRASRVPLVVMSESKYDDEQRVWWKEEIKRRLYVRHFSAALVGGRRHREYLVRLGMSPDVIFLGYDAVDNQHFTRGAEEARATSDETGRQLPAIPARPYFLASSRFIPRKNLQGLVEAYALYRRDVTEPWDLVVCGSGPGEADLRRTIAENGLQDVVHLPGFVPYESLGAWYGLAGAFVHPPLMEQWGLVVNEACAAGLPILCSRAVGAQDELVVEGKNGLLFDPADREDMQRRLTEMQRLSPEQRCRMGRASQEIVAEFGPERFADGFVAAVDAAYGGATR